MDTSLYIDIPKKHYTPGETVTGTILWALDEPPESIHLTLGWWTEGRGTIDASVEVSQEWETSSVAGEETFAFTIPPSPYSFSGTLITLKWAIEISTRKGKKTSVEPILVSPTDHLITLSHLDEGRRKSFSFGRSR